MRKIFLPLVSVFLNNQFFGAATKKFYSGFLILPLLITIFNVGVMAQDLNLYSFSTGTGATLDPMSGATSLIGSGSDDGASLVNNIGFSFTLKGVAYTQFSANANGLARLGATAVSTSFSNSTTSTAFNPKIMPLWDDLATGTTGAVSTVLIGTAPNRIRVVQWFVTIPRNTTGAANSTFQLWLYETTNVVEFRYGSGGTAASATIGLSDAIATTGDFNVVTSTTTHLNSTVSAGINNSITTWPGSGRRYTWTPPTPCSGTPAPGNTIASTTSVCFGGGTTNLSLQNATSGTGVTYQWQSSSNGSAWSNISGATNNTYAATVTTSTFFRCAVTCSGNTGNSNSIQITTAAAPSYPYSEGFESISPIGSGLVPSCWVNQTGTNAWRSSNAATSTFNDPRTGSNYMTMNWSNTAMSYLWTPFFSMTAGNTYRFKFYYVGDGFAGWSGQYFTNTAQSATGATLRGTFISATTTSSATYSEVIYDFIPTSSGNYTFGIGVTSTGVPWYLGIDDVSVTELVPCAAPAAQPTGLNFSGITASGLTGTFTAATGSPSGYLVIQTTSSTAPTSPANGTTYSVGAAALGGTVVASGAATSFSVSGLNGGSQYYYWIYSYNSTCIGADPTYNSVSPLNGNSTTLPCSISGQKTIGTGGDYPSLTAALTDINVNGIVGGVTLLLTNTYTSTAEASFPITIPSIGCASASNTLTIKPAAGVTSSISPAANSNPVFRITGSHIIIDGSNNGSTSRDLLIENRGSTAPQVIVIGSVGTSAVSNVTVKNANIKNGLNTQSAVILGSSTGGNGYFNNILIENNAVTKAYIAFYCAAVPATGNGNGLIIRNNSLDNPGSDSLRYLGVYVQGVDGAQITANRIGNFSTTESEDDKGIYLGPGTRNTTVSRNEVYNIRYSGTGGYGAQGVFVNVDITDANIVIANNFIRGISGDGWSYTSIPTDNPIGIAVVATVPQSGINIHHNTIGLTGNTLNKSNAMSMGIWLSSGSSASVSNNIISNKLGLASTTGYGSVGIYAVTSNSQFTSLDNNIYDVTPSGSGVKHIGQIASSGVGTLSAWSTASGGDQQSRVYSPVFVSSTDLHLSSVEGLNWASESAGAPISSVTTDIDGDARSTTRPDIGADEFTATSFVVTNPAAVCAPNTVDITAAAVTAGTTSGTTFTYWTNAAGTVTLTTPAAVAASGTYYIKATYGSADNYWIKPVVVTVNPLPTPSVGGAENVCRNDASNVYSTTNVAGNTYNWTVTGGTITSGQGTNSINIAWTAAGTASITVTETITATGCSRANTLVVNVSPNPAPVITGQTAACTTTEGNIYSVASVAGNTYAWSVAGGTVTAGAGTNAITVTWGAVGAGSVTVTQTVTATGCATTVSSAINIQTLPTANATIVEPVNCASEDGQINLTLGGAAGPYTFAWTGTGNGITASTQNQSAVSTGFYNVVVTAANGCTTSLTNVVVSGPGGCFICPSIGTISATASIICQEGANTISVSGLADLGITYGIRFKYSATPLANPYLSTAGIVMGTIANANLTGFGSGASINYNFPTAGTMYVYAILSPASPDPACRPFLMIPVEVAPTPVLTDPADQVRCTGAATSAVSLVATPSATTTFAWTNNRTSIGLAASGTGNIASFTATNFSNAPVTATVIVTPTNTQTLGASTVACPGPTQSYTYTVNPIPTVNTVTDQKICAGANVSLPFSGFVAGTVFDWTNSNTSIGLAASGAGTLSFTATNTTSSPITATIIVTPKFTNAGVTCTGNPISFDITVNPTPVVDAVPAQVLCSGSATTAISLTSATTGTAFSWTNSATSIGLAGTGTGTSIASFTAVNTGAAPVNAIISITPSYTGAGFTCSGVAGTTTITVNPVPTATAINNSVICNGAATTYTLTGSATAATYNWTNSNTDIGLAGTGSGTIAFTASNTTASPITSTITVTPSVTNGGLTCTGGTISFTVMVNPSGQVNAVDNQALCNGSTTGAVTFSTVNNGLISTGGTQVAASGTISVAVPDASAVGATHTIPVTLPTGAVITNMRVTMNLTHTWISDMIINLRAPNGQVLNLFNGHGGSGDNLVNTVISSTGTASLASGTAPFTGTFAATAAIGVGPTGNASTAANFAALYSTTNGNWVLSMRDLFGGDLGTLTGWSISFDYVVQGQFGTNMNWTNSLSSIGLAASGTGNIPAFTAVNTGAAPVTSTVTVTPTYFNAGTSCPGAPITFTYTVNPTPTVNTVANQVFCAGTPSTVNFSGATTGTVYNWTSSNTAIGLAASGTGNLSFTPTNTTNAPIVSTITVTPVFTNAGVTCTGTPRTFTITVNPVGQVNAVSNQVICNGAGTTAVNFATVNGGGTVQVGTPVTVNSGAITVVVPDFNPAGATHSLPVTLPAGATITGVSVNFNMTHTWLADMVINLRAPNGQILNLVNRRGGSGDNFVNTTISSASTTSLATGAAPFTGTFAADAAAGVGPTTFVSAATNFAALYSVANGDWTLGMRDYAGGDVGTLTGWSITFNYTTVAGAVTTYNWTNTTPSIGLAASGVGNIASFAAVNTSTVPVTATVSVIPTYTNAGVGCAGPASSFTYTVNPTPTVNAISNQTVCRGSNVAAISFGGTVPGTVYNWTNTNTAIGLAASGTGDIASFVGANTTAAPISGTITVTPVFTNAGITCTGTPRTFTITVNPIPTVNPVASFPICHNSVAAVTFSGATTGTVFNWTNTNTTIGLAASGSGNLNFTALNTTSAPTVATITVTPVFANAGTTCTGTPTSFTITVNPLPVVSAGTLPARICISDTLVPLNGTPVGGSWSGIGTSGMSFIPTATAVGTWPITYTFSDLNGCTNRATIAATVLTCEERDRDLDNSAVLLYPNPNSGQFNLRINSTRFNALGMRVFNTAGQLVSTKQWSGLVYARVVPVNLTHLPAGIYMVRLYYGDGMDRGADKTYQIIIAR